MQGVDPRDRKVVGEPAEVQDPKDGEVVSKVMLAELVKVSVDEPVWRDHVGVDARLVLVACWSYQLGEWVVQDCLCGNERELV